ncbi:MAG: hypothetical protein RLZZ306_1636 [Bacteroidota bacterium]
MKKNVLLSLFILLGVYEGYSQRYNSEPRYERNDGPGFFSRFYKLKMGFKFSPGFLINYVESTKNFKGFASNGANVRLSLGPVVDMYITDKYALSCGLWYCVYSVNYSLHGSFFDTELFNTNPFSWDVLR